MRLGRLLCAGAAALLITGSAPAAAGPAEDVLAVYQAFAAAQNTRDTGQIGAFFIDGPDFLWVSDGRSYWGREAVLARMGSFQKAEVWHVVPDLASARVVFVEPGVAILNMRLVLEIGAAADPDELGFLVSIVFRRIDDDWRIAALLTTNDKTPRG
jgi:uncharacterized protein (TIGR02246 family)